MHALRPRRAAGFTLLELMLAMSSLALLSAICYGAFHLGWRAVQRGEVAVVTAQRLRVASDVIIRQIKSTAAYAMRTPDEDIFPYFYGTPTWMKFITTGGLGQGGGLTRVVYHLENDPPRLILEETRDFTPDSLGTEGEGLGASTGRSTILLDGFRDLHFAYMLNESGDTEWKDVWSPSEEEALPAAVRIVVRGMPGLEVDTWGQEIPVMCTVITGESPEPAEPPEPEGGEGEGEADPEGGEGD